MRTKKHKIEIYNSRMILIECGDVNKLNEFFEKNTDGFYFEEDSIFAHSIHANYKEKGKLWSCIYLVFNPKNEYSSVTVGTIAHEAFHAASFIFEKIGADDDCLNSEPLAYLIDHIAELVNKFLNNE